MSESTEPRPFAHLIQDAIEAAATPERIAAIATKHVDQLVEGAVAAAFSSWTDTGKTITRVITESLRVKDLDLPAYGHVVSEIVRRAVDGRVAEMVSAKLAKDLEELLALAPKSIRLSKLIESGIDLKRDQVFGYGPRTPFKLGRFFHFEQRILSMYACETILVLDEDDVVTHRDND